MRARRFHDPTGSPAIPRSEPSPDQKAEEIGRRAARIRAAGGELMSPAEAKRAAARMHELFAEICGAANVSDSGRKRITRTAIAEAAWPKLQAADAVSRLRSYTLRENGSDQQSSSTKRHLVRKGKKYLPLIESAARLAGREADIDIILIQIFTGTRFDRPDDGPLAPAGEDDAADLLRQLEVSMQRIAVECQVADYYRLAVQRGLLRDPSATSVLLRSAPDIAAPSGLPLKGFLPYLPAIPGGLLLPYIHLGRLPTVSLLYLPVCRPIPVRVEVSPASAGAPRASRRRTGGCSNARLAVVRPEVEVRLGIAPRDEAGHSGGVLELRHVCHVAVQSSGSDTEVEFNEFWPVEPYNIGGLDDLPALEFRTASSETERFRLRFLDAESGGLIHPRSCGSPGAEGHPSSSLDFADEDGAIPDFDCVTFYPFDHPFARQLLLRDVSEARAPMLADGTQQIGYAAEVHTILPLGTVGAAIELNLAGREAGRPTILDGLRDEAQALFSAAKAATEESRAVARARLRRALERVSQGPPAKDR